MLLISLDISATIVLISAKTSRKTTKNYGIILIPREAPCNSSIWRTWGVTNSESLTSQLWSRPNCTSISWRKSRGRTALAAAQVAMSHSKHFETQSAMEKTFKRFTSQQPTAFSSHLTFWFKCDSQEKCEAWISLGRPRKVFPSDRSRAGTNSPREIDCRAIRRAPVRQLEPLESEPWKCGGSAPQCSTGQHDWNDPQTIRFKHMIHEYDSDLNAWFDMI